MSSTAMRGGTIFCVQLGTGSAAGARRRHVAMQKLPHAPRCVRGLTASRRYVECARPVDSRACHARRRDVEDDFTRGELLDNGEVPTSQERESVAARLRRRRMQMRAEVSGANGVRQRRRRPAADDVILDVDAMEDEEGNVGFYDVDIDADVVEEVEDGYGEEAGGEAYQAGYDDPYLGWGDGPAGNESWSEDQVDPGRRGLGRGRDGRQNNDEYKGGDGETSASSTPLSSGEYQNTTNMLEPPDIVILSPEELDRVLPVLPFSEQADFFAGGAAQAVQRWGASLALTVLFSKAALIAATSLTWPLWWPWARAANKNFGVRSKVEYGGIWRTRILKVEKGSRPRPRFGEEEELRNMPRFSAMKSCTIVIGEENGAQTELLLPFDARYELLQPGQPAEVLVLSDSTSFSDIKAIKDVYLPENGLWLAEYPYVDRAEFLEVSLDIERETSGDVDGYYDGDYDNK